MRHRSRLSATTPATTGGSHDGPRVPVTDGWVPLSDGCGCSVILCTPSRGAARALPGRIRRRGVGWASAGDVPGAERGCSSLFPQEVVGCHPLTSVRGSQARWRAFGADRRKRSRRTAWQCAGSALPSCLALPASPPLGAAMLPRVSASAEGAIRSGTSSGEAPAAVSGNGHRRFCCSAQADPDRKGWVRWCPRAARPAERTGENAIEGGSSNG